MRVCANRYCDADISHKRKDARWCSSLCSARHHQNIGRMKSRPCAYVDCDNDLKGKQKSAHYCSELCRDRQRLLTRVLKRRGRNGRSGAIRIGATHRCNYCCQTFTASRKGQMYCPGPKRCVFYAGKRRREMRQRGVFSVPYSRQAIFERDTWLCQLCGHPVDQDGDPFSANAPTVDHIVPVTAGGPDIPDNLQLAHRGCNSSKSDKLEAVAA